MGAGDSLDFTVGTGNNTNPYYDTTGLDAVVTASSVDVVEASRDREFSLAVIPNPARVAASFAIRLPRESMVRVRVLGLSGRLVREIWNGALPVGTSQLSWNRLDTGARVVASGLYLVRVDAGERTLTSKVIVAQ
jgi:hypothetical protein